MPRPPYHNRPAALDEVYNRLSLPLLCMCEDSVDSRNHPVNVHKRA
jgi:hypothetical protein